MVASAGGESTGGGGGEEQGRPEKLAVIAGVGVSAGKNAAMEEMRQREESVSETSRESRESRAGERGAPPSAMLLSKLAG